MAKKPLLVRDIIHGDMYFNHPLELVIDHPLFQRLKFIVQNGICYQVFPGMTHTRFQHSLGVCSLSLKWFDNLFEKTNTLDLLQEIQKEKQNPIISDGYEISLSDTILCYQFVKTDEEKWKILIGIAALCHDLGHGPFSHLLEEAGFIPVKKIISDYETEFSDKANPTLVAYLNHRYVEEKRNKVDHEDITLMYLSVIFYDLKNEHKYFGDDINFHIVCCLISKDYKKFYLKNYLAEKIDIETSRTVNLFSSMTSGFIDADRLDYMVRDSTMAGVHIGRAEVHKITSSLIPCLFKHNDEFKSGFLANYKYHHIIDNFFFNLYQVYTQVIFHPRALQFNHELTEIFQKYANFLSSYKPNQNYLNWHKNKNDLLFIEDLRNNDFDPSQNTKLIDKVLNRHIDYKQTINHKSVYSLPKETQVPIILKDHKPLKTHGRDMIKDGAFIWLFNKLESDYKLHSWKECSVVYQNLKDHSFKPNIFWKNDNFEKDLKTLKEVAPIKTNHSLSLRAYKFKKVVN